MKRFRNWLRKLAAECRGEKIISPELRGRVCVKAELKPTICAKVYRAAEGKWYDLGKISG